MGRLPLLEVGVHVLMRLVMHLLAELWCYGVGAKIDHAVGRQFPVSF